MRRIGLPGLAPVILISVIGLVSVCPAAAAPGAADAGRPTASPSEARRLPTIHVKASDYHYALSRPHLPAGPVKVAFTNQGPHTHALQTARLDPGRTQADFVRVLHGFLDGTITEAPPWLHDATFAFGPTSPGRSVTTSIRLNQPGRYVLYDLLTGRSGKTFAELGMVGSFSVSGQPRGGALPQADAVITGSDSAFDVPRLRAGRLVLELRNDATVERQFAIVQLNDRRTLEDMRTWIEGGQVGPAPGEFVANVLPIAAGHRLLLHLRLTTGHYLLVDDGVNDDGVPYSELGLLTRFVVCPPG